MTLTCHSCCQVLVSFEKTGNMGSEQSLNSLGELLHQSLQNFKCQIFEKSEVKVFTLPAHCSQCLCGRVSRKRLITKALGICMQKLAVFNEVKMLPLNAAGIAQLLFPGVKVKLKHHKGTLVESFSSSWYLVSVTHLSVARKKRFF